MANVKRTSMFLDRDLVTQAAERARHRERHRDRPRRHAATSSRWTRGAQAGRRHRAAPSSIPSTREELLALGHPTRLRPSVTRRAWIALRRGRPPPWPACAACCGVGPSRMCDPVALELLRGARNVRELNAPARQPGPLPACADRRRRLDARAGRARGPRASSRRTPPRRASPSTSSSPPSRTSMTSQSSTTTRTSTSSREVTGQPMIAARLGARVEQDLARSCGARPCRSGPGARRRAGRSRPTTARSSPRAARA